MNKNNFILVLLLSFIFLSCDSENDSYVFRASPNFYFQPNFLDTVEYKGEVNKNGIAEGKWKINLRKSKMEVDLQPDALSNLDYVIPTRYELKEKTPNGFVWYTYNDESIMIFLDTIKSLNLKGGGIILNEISGISQLCPEDTSCTPIDYQGNLIRYEDDYFSGVYYFREKKDAQFYNKLGYIGYVENQLILFVYQFPENKDLQLNQSLFTLLTENILVNKKNLIPPMVKYKSMKPMNFSAALKNI